MTQDQAAAATEHWAFAFIDVEVVNDERGVESGEGIRVEDGVGPAGGAAQNEVAEGGRPGGVFKTQSAPAGVVSSDDVHGGGGGSLDFQDALDA